MALGVHSEVGRLRKVMVHRPGLEHARLTPSNAEELLFDDVIWVARAKQEHDRFVEVMRERGVEVFEAETLLAEALDEPGVRDWVADHILDERDVGIKAADRAREWATSADAALVAEFLVGGITRADIDQDVGLVWESADPTSMLLPPLPNFLFQRDCSCWIFDGVTLNPMTKPARVIPPIKNSATSAASEDVTHSRARSAALIPTSRSSRMCSATQSRTPGWSSASVSKVSASNTSTPRSRITSTNRSCSCLALATQMTSSKSNSPAFDGVSRACSRPGRCTITLRSRPTSECTPNGMPITSLAGIQRENSLTRDADSGKRACQVPTAPGARMGGMARPQTHRQ